MTGKPLLSRVADSVYWMSRYMERAENVARFIDVNLHLMLDAPVGEPQQWEPIVDTSGDSALFRQRYGEASRDAVIRFLTFDLDNPNSILSCLRAARENARSVRETISSEMWEQVNKVYLMVCGSSMDRVMEAPHDFFYRVKMGCHLFQGLTHATMTHGQAWHFIHLGQKLERADKTTRLLDVKYFILLPSVAFVGSPFDDIHWAAVLKSVSAYEMYRKKHGRIRPNRIVDFLVLDNEFPRAVRYCLVGAAQSLSAITGTPFGNFRNEAEQRLGQLRAELDYANVDQIIREGLHEFLDSLQTKMNRVDDCIRQTFFALRPYREEP